MDPDAVVQGLRNPLTLLSPQPMTTTWSDAENDPLEVALSQRQLTCEAFLCGYGSSKGEQSLLRATAGHHRRQQHRTSMCSVPTDCLELARGHQDYRKECHRGG